MNTDAIKQKQRHPDAPANDHRTPVRRPPAEANVMSECFMMNILPSVVHDPIADWDEGVLAI